MGVPYSAPVHGFQHFAEAWLVPAQLFFTMLGMGATLSARDFLELARRPHGVGVGVVLQLVAVPLLAMLFVALLDIPPGWAVGLFLVAAVPGGAASNLLTFIGKGSVPLSIAITTLTTLVSLVSVPLVLRLTASQHLPEDFSLPTLQVIREIGLWLLGPLALGMLFRRVWPQHSGRLEKIGVRTGIALILVIAISSVGSGRLAILEHGPWPPARIALFVLLLLLLAPQLCRLLGQDDPSTIAISVEVVVRNTSIGLLLVHYFFPGRPEQGEVLYTCLLYAGLAAPSTLPMLLRHRRGHSAVLFRAPRPAERS
ncbi:MAG: bile acid:sodium symporter family protein [Deltaproteobacteria bacterium]|nr:bile acid:sodium symporter family protein [Deltaproteobacteria bacterium]